MVRQLIVRSRRRRAGSRAPASTDAPGQWLVVTADEVELAAEPSDLMALRLGLEASVQCATREAGPRLVSWLVTAECTPAVWSSSEREALFHLLRSGTVRSWRLLEVTGLLSRCFPALDEAIARRKRDSFHLDPGADLRFGLLEDLRTLVSRRPPLPANQRALEVWDELGIKNLVFLAALSGSLYDDGPHPDSQAAALAEVIGLPPADVATVRSLVAERGLLRAAALRMDMGTEDSILELAAHIGRRELADAIYVLVVAEGGLEWGRERLDEQFELVRSALEHPDLAGAGDLVELRRAQIARELHHLPAAEVARHLEAAPRRYLVSHSPEVVARHLRMTSTPLGRFEVRLEAEPDGPPGAGRWWVHVAARDRDGLLARIAWALARHEVSVQEAFVSTWADGKAIDVFRVDAPADMDWEQARQSIAGALVHSVNGTELAPVDGVVDVDNAASPWYTILEVRAYDRSGLLWRVAAALANAGLRIHAALVTTGGDVAVDVFYVTGAGGGKLDDAGERDVRLALSGKPPRRWRPWRQGSPPRGGPDISDPEPAAPAGPAPT
jgi:[protein-PII] uridylyltransferase